MSALTDKLARQAQEKPPQVVDNKQNIKESVQPKSGHSSQAENIPNTNPLRPRPTAQRAEPREKQYLYSTPQSPTFSIHLTGETVQSNKGVMVLNQVQHDEVQNLITKHRRFDISQNMVLMDLSGAEEVARRHMAEEANKPQAARGMSSTSHSAARKIMLDGHEVEDKLSVLDVIEQEAAHGEDMNVDPETGKPADNIPRT